MFQYNHYFCTKLFIMLTILRFDFSDKELFQKALQIRTAVFVEEQKTDPALEYDEYESVSHHYLVTQNNSPVATARWRETDKGIKFERFAVCKERRGKGTGSLLLKEVLKDTLPLSKPIYLHSQHTAVNLYLKSGFEIAGEPFEEAGIMHYLMEYKRNAL